MALWRTTARGRDVGHLYKGNDGSTPFLTPFLINNLFLYAPLFFNIVIQDIMAYRMYRDAFFYEQLEVVVYFCHYDTV